MNKAPKKTLPQNVLGEESSLPPATQPSFRRGAYNASYHTARLTIIRISVDNVNFRRHHEMLSNGTKCTYMWQRYCFQTSPLIRSTQHGVLAAVVPTHVQGRREEHALRQALNITRVPSFSASVHEILSQGEGWGKTYNTIRARRRNASYSEKDIGCPQFSYWSFICNIILV